MEKTTTVHKGYHCTWQIHYHIVCPVKYRKALIDQDIAKRLVTTAKDIQERYAIEFEAIGTDQDHIHILCNAHPKLAPGRIVQMFKSITARRLFVERPDLKKELWGGEFWTDGYYIGTVGERGNWSVVERYVKNQGQTVESLKQLKLL